MLKLTKYLTHSYTKPDSWRLAAYEQAGGYRSVRKALGMARDALIDEVKKAHIRGRGGADSTRHDVSSAEGRQKAGW